MEAALASGDIDLVRVHLREQLAAASAASFSHSSRAEADRHLVPDRITQKDLMAVYSSHPHGSTRMSGDPELGAVDCRGALYGTEGLYVMDGSVLPDVLGVNPQVTIMALSSLLADGLAAELT